MRIRHALAAAVLALATAAGSVVVAAPLAAQAVLEDAPHQVLVLIRMPAPHAAPAGVGAGYGDDAGQGARKRIARRLAHAHGLKLVGGWPMPLLGVDCYVMDVPPDQSVEKVAAILAAEPGVTRAEANHAYMTEGEVARDPLYRAQPTAALWSLERLHSVSTGEGVKVAVIDSMVDASHPDLAGQVAVTRNFTSGRRNDPEAHGTAVAGVIGARSGNGVGIVGVAPGARLMALRACWQGGAGGRGAAVCDTYSLAQALHYAIEHGAQVINLSLAGPPDPILASLIDVALARGVKVVAAVDGRMAGGGFPASHPGVIAVADTPYMGRVPGVVSAPGRDVPTTAPGGRWTVSDGSSFAAAQVSGLFALGGRAGPAGVRQMKLVTHSEGHEIDACASLLQDLGRARGPCETSPVKADSPRQN